MTQTSPGPPTGTSSQAVLVERCGHTMIVTLNRPESRNAINLAVALGVGEALEDAEADPDLRVVVITGAGGKSFCAGADLKAVARGESLTPSEPHQQAWGFAGYVRHHISKPTIAAVNGTALGGGTEIVLASDLAVASENAAFGLPEVKRGILAAAGGVIRLPQQIPFKRAMELILTGDPIDAATALELGLVNRVVAPEVLLDAAIELADRIAVNAPLSVQASKRIARGIRDGAIRSEDEAWTQNAQESLALRGTQDAMEGPRAFAEKRPPRWLGR